MSQFKIVLSALASVALGEIAQIWYLSRGAKAVGVGALLASLSESIVSPFFWLVAASSFAVFFYAQRSPHPAVRVLFFWIPTVTTGCLSGTIAALIAYLQLSFRNR